VVVVVAVPGIVDTSHGSSRETENEQAYVAE